MGSCQAGKRRRISTAAPLTLADQCKSGRGKFSEPAVGKFRNGDAGIFQRTEIIGEMADGTLKVKIAAPPEKGKANDVLCAFLATHYGVARDAVTIVSGHSAALKLVRVKKGS